MNSPVPKQPVTARGVVRALVAGLQIFAGASALYFDGKLLLTPSVTALATVGLELFLVAAGIALIIDLRTGRLLTIIAQGMQLVGLATPGFTYLVYLGFATRIQLAGVPSDVPGESIGTVAASLEYASEVHLAWGHPHPEHEGYMLSFNFAALVILLTVILLFRGRRPAAAGATLS